jgi:hypothetical protein
LQGGASITKEKLLSAGKLKSSDFVVARFTITIEGAVVDLDEKINDSNSFSGEGFKLIGSMVKGDLMVFDCIAGKNKKGAVIICKPFYFIIK